MDDHEWAAYAVRNMLRRALQGLATQFALDAMEVQRWPR